MASLESFIPVFLTCETGVVLDKDETLEELFERSKKEGYNTKNSVCGVNFELYDDYRKSQGIPNTSRSLLKVITFEEWSNIMLNEFWLKCNATAIVSQKVANFIADWYFASNIECFHQLNKSLLKIDSYNINSDLIKAINSYDEDNLINTILIPNREKYVKSLDLTDTKKKYLIERFKNM